MEGWEEEKNEGKKKYKKMRTISVSMPSSVTG